MNQKTTLIETSRDRHLFGSGPKRLLALDGGGVRGALSIGFLEKIEAVLDAQHGKKITLGDHIDFVGGTSTGAIIAGAIALGHRVEEIKDFYLKLAPLVFKKQRWHLPVFQAKFKAANLQHKLTEVLGDRQLSSPDLITGLGIVTKQIDTGSPWILSNNPRTPFWEDGEGFIGNKHFPLANLVRASTAAPHFFDPELIPITASEKVPALSTYQWSLFNNLKVAIERLLMRRNVVDSKRYGLFVDGGVTPHNNPSLALFHLVTLRCFGICWPTGVENITIVSVGTGSHRPKLAINELGLAGFPKLAIHALRSLITNSQMLVLAFMQWMGECPTPWEINSEIKSLAGEAPQGGKMFRFLRYDVRLDKEWLAMELNYPASDAGLVRLRGMDDPGMVEELYRIGKAAADKQVKPDHWTIA